MALYQMASLCDRLGRVEDDGTELASWERRCVFWRLWEMRREPLVHEKLLRWLRPSLGDERRRVQVAPLEALLVLRAELEDAMKELRREVVYDGHRDGMSEG